MYIISLQTVYNLSEDVGAVPKHVGDFENYVQFINLLSAFFGIYYCKNNARKP